MNDSRPTPTGSNSSRAGWLQQVVSRYEAACRAALGGGPTPELGSFLAEVSQFDEPELRSALEAVQRTFEQQRTRSVAQSSSATVAWSAGKAGAAAGGASSVVADSATVHGLGSAASPRAESPPQATSDAGPPASTECTMAADASRRAAPADDRLSAGATLPFDPRVPRAADCDQTALIPAADSLDGEPAAGSDRTVLLPAGDSLVAVGTTGTEPPLHLAAVGDEPSACDATLAQEPAGAPAAAGATLAHEPADAPSACDATLAQPSDGDGFSPTVNLDRQAADDSADDFVVGEPAPELTGDREVRPTLPGYEILGVLGRGGMGVVYRARQKKLDRIVALKMVIAGAHAEPERLRRFQAEGHAVAHLQHPHIVQIYEVGEHQGLPFFSLEFVPGGSLSQKMAGKPQPDLVAARTVETLARAMHYAHQHGIVHRDLKPDNVLLTADGVPKVTDFGLVKRLEDDSSNTRTGAILGTPSYMAPEQARGEVHDIGPPSDIYSLGAVLYAMIAGRPPFLSPNPLDTVMQVTRDEPVPPRQLQPTISQDLETICLKCLQKEKAKRYATAEELAEDLRRFQAGEPIAARPVGAAERLWRWCRRNPRVAVLSGTVAVLLLVSAIGGSGMAVVIQRRKLDADAARQVAETNELAAHQARRRAEAAETVAKANERRAVENEHRAERNAQLAAEQAELAVDALKTVVSEVDKELRDRPKTRTMRSKVLSLALEKFDRVLASAATVTTLERTRAAAYMQRAIIYQQLGDRNKAADDQKQAHQILERLAASPPTGVDADKGRGNLAGSFDWQGDMSRADPPTSRKHYLEALRLRQDLLANPRSDFYTPHARQMFVADSYDKLGQIAAGMEDVAESLKYHEQALPLRRACLAAAPTTPEYQLGLAATLTALAGLRMQLGQWSAAKELLAEVIATRQPFVQRDALNLSHRLQLGQAYRTLGDATLCGGKPADAAVHYREFLTHSQALLDLEPEQSAYARHVASANYRLGVATLHAEGATAADRHFQTGLALLERLAARKEVPKTTAFKQEYMLALGRGGRHAQAAALAEEVSLVEPQHRNLVQAACGYSVCIAGVAHLRAAAELTAADLAKQREYAEHALDFLARAIAKGYKDRVVLQTDPDLEAVRQHDGFAKLLQSLPVATPVEPEAAQASP